MSKLLDYIDKFKDISALVIGDVILDNYIYGDVDRISPEAPIPVVKVHNKKSVLGGAANTAINMKKLGANVSLCGVIGDDADGKLLRSYVVDAGIEDTGLTTVNDRHTTVKTRVLGRSQQIVRIDEENIKPIGDAVSFDVINYIDDLSLIVVSDYGKGVISKRLMKYLTDIKYNEVISLAVDPCVDNYDLYKGVTLLTPNMKEALFYTNSIGVIGGTAATVGKSMVENLNCGEVLITRGEDGMSYIDAYDNYTHIPTVAKDVFDVSGAGDTVIGVYSLARQCGAAPKYAMQLANIAAGIVVGKVGTAFIDIDTLRKEVIEFERI